MKKIRKSLIDIKFKISTYKIILFVFIVGLIIGSIYANLMDKAKLREIQNINSYFYEKYKFIKINYVDLLGNVMFDRVKIVTIIWILGLTFLAIPVVLGMTAYYGFSLGFILSISTMNYGIMGIVIGTIFLLPQYLLYTPAIVFLMKRSTEVSKKMYFDKLGGRSLDKNEKKQMLIEYIFIFFIALCIIILGALLETFINPSWVLFSANKLI